MAYEGNLPLMAETGILQKASGGTGIEGKPFGNQAAAEARTEGLVLDGSAAGVLHAGGILFPGEKKLCWIILSIL